MKPEQEEIKKRKVKGQGRPKSEPEESESEPEPEEPEPEPPFIVTVKMMCTILGMREYPMIVTEKTKELFKTYEEFEQFYLPRMATISDYHELILKTFCRAKYREIMAIPEE